MYDKKMPEFTIMEYKHLIDSSCIEPSDWQRIVSDIETNYYNYDGFVVIMGTDTMAYTASALSFMLENLAKPVIVTGSAIPMSNVFNDSFRNLILSVLFASYPYFTEVCVFFNDRLLRGNRSSKVDSTSLGAFDSPNFPPLAIVGAEIKLRAHLAHKPPHRAFSVQKKLTNEIVVFKLIPGFDDSVLYNIIMSRTKSLIGIILELYGVGNAPTKRVSLLKALMAAKERNIVVVASSQCMTGGVYLETYEVGAQMSKLGVISGMDNSILLFEFNYACILFNKYFLINFYSCL